MPMLKNTGKQPIRAVTGHVVMPNAEIEVDLQTLERFASDPYMCGQIKRGLLVVTNEAQPSQEDRNRSWIAKAKKAELVAAIKQGTDFGDDVLSTMKVDELREVAVEVLIGEDD